MTSNPLIEAALLEVLSACLQLKVSRKQSGVRVPVLPAASASFLSVLDVLFLNAALPHDLQNSWRQLFSTAVHGESFSKLIGAIVNRGPTLVIVKGQYCGPLNRHFVCRILFLSTVFYSLPILNEYRYLLYYIQDFFFICACFPGDKDNIFGGFATDSWRPGKLYYVRK